VKILEAICVLLLVAVVVLFLTAYQHVGAEPIPYRVLYAVRVVVQAIANAIAWMEAILS